MEIVQTNKLELFREIEQLPNLYLIELQNFIKYLKFKQSSSKTKSEKFSLSPENDPIIQLIGLAEVSPFSDKIDEMLYGAV